MKNWEVIIKKYKSFRNLPSEEHLEQWVQLKCLDEQLDDIRELRKIIARFEIEYDKTLKNPLIQEMLYETEKT